jgi:hypothetical protein
MYVIAALGIVGIIVQWASKDILLDISREAAKGQENAGDPDTAVTIQLVGATAIGLLFAAGFVVCAMFNNRGNNVTRIITWVLCGLGLCCVGLGTVGAAMTPGSDIPAWYLASQWISLVVSVALYVAVIVLLALPKSNDYFRPKPAGQLY